MTPWINYHHLFYFKTFVEEGTVSKAAEKLMIGQPTLSSQLKQFEESLGVQLFERKHKRLFVTEQGKVTYEYAKHIFKLGSEMYEVLHDRLRPTRPTLHIGTIDSIPKQVTAKLVEKALKIAPCQITLLEGSSDFLLRELNAHRIDLVATNSPPRGHDAKGIYSKQITKKNIAIYGAPKFKKLKRKFPKSIDGQPVVFPTYDSKLRPDLDHWAKTLELEVDIVIESQDIAVKKMLAIKEAGLIAAAPYSVAREVTAGHLIEIGKATGIYEEVYLLTAQKKVPHPIANSLIEKFKI